MESNGSTKICADSSNTDDAASSTRLSTPPSDLEEETLPADHLDQIWAWNTPVPPTLKICMHELVKKQALKEPTRAAIHSWDGHFTYHDVDSLSDLFSAHLISLGVRSGTVVPLCFEKSKWTAVAVLAVMKAGGAFALMDPSQPEGRLQTIVEQTGATVIVTSHLQEDIGGRIAPTATNAILSEAHMKDLDASCSVPSVLPESNLYIQFTSGSTGKPKGVVITHENYTSGAIPRAEAVGYRAHSRVLDFASYAFDVCIDCMLCTLSVGGCLCIPSDADRVNDLSGAIRKMSVSMAHMTPSVARVLDPDIIPNLEVLGLGGEAISAGDAAIWSRTTKVINAYGPSECTVGCTINSDVGAERGKPQISIGRGVGATTWIVDPFDHNRLVLVGDVGELLIEGPIVGLGYLNGPEKTVAAFVNNPKWLLAGNAQHEGRTGRLYKTGDLVRYDTTDGTIFFVGRGDQQVKLRGQRIELAEIEYNMRDKLPPGTRVAAEVIKPGAAAEPTLVAFVAERAGLVSESEQLLGTHSPPVRDALARTNKVLSESLPIYMIPAAYIPLQIMPLLVSAKTDRKRLREVGSMLSRKDIAGFAAMSSARREPSTDMERKLAQLWTQLLGLDAAISASDNFFYLGGDSLRAMKLVALARNEEITLSVAGIFSNSVLADMAIVARPLSKDVDMDISPFSLINSRMSEAAARSECAALCKIDPEKIEDVYPCTPLQEGLMALSAKVSEAYVAQRVVELSDETTARKLLNAFDYASRECAILRTRIVQMPVCGLLQVVVKDTFGFTCTSKQGLSEYLAEDRGKPMNLGTPLVRYTILCDEGSSGKTHFILTIHHALYDGWSMPLVVERVNRAYLGLEMKRPAEFKHFIRYLGDLDRRDSEEYWRERLRGANPDQFPPLPFSGYQARADSLLEHYVKTPRPSTGMTMATIIRGAWALLVSMYADSDDVVFGETITGRNAPIPGIEQIEGPMIATIPVRIRIDADATVSEYLQTTHDRSVNGIPHEHFGLQHIRRLSPDAREACELRTGVILHPSAETQDSSTRTEEQPADGFVPAGDAEAAQEALKFNTYPLMLVCSLDLQGFLVMASFDSRTVKSTQLERMLSQLGRVTQQFIENPDTRCGELDILTEHDISELERLSYAGAQSLRGSADLLDYGDVSETWIVDPINTERLVPTGAKGELVVRSTVDADTEVVNDWKLARHGQEGKLYRTYKSARYAEDGSIEIIEKSIRKESTPELPEPHKNRVSATSEKQRRLRRAWSRILSVEEDEIGLNDSFFQLGGDSIGAMKIVSELRGEGWELTVPDIFKSRTLYEMAKVTKESSQSSTTVVRASTTPFSLLEVGDIEHFIESTVQPNLHFSLKDSRILDIIPARPLQQIAVKGTTQLPRFSARYELFFLNGAVDEAKLFSSCQELLTRSEILRTVFIESATECFGVVLESLTAKIDKFEIDGDLPSFAHQLCDLDIRTKMPLGSSFVKFFHIKGESDRSCLILRISHAQYDEICLVGLLRQLSALYDGRASDQSVPFSTFVYHVVKQGIPQCIPYWQNLLHGSSMSTLRPDIPLTHKTPASVHRTMDTSARLKDITMATLPTAAWALCLARHLAVRDVVFGEVVSGRNIDLSNADAVMGPTWQYVPVRVKLEENWKYLDLLQRIQHQHIASAQHEGMGLNEIIRDCTDWNPEEVSWFDSVVHQDVYHVEELKFGDAQCRLETVYPHLEPLREWKIQAFVKGDNLTLEIVTFEEWLGVARELLDDLEKVMMKLVKCPTERIFYL